jgi:hypothetical protein
VHELEAPAAGELVGLASEEDGHLAVAARDGAVDGEQADEVIDGVERP